MTTEHSTYTYEDGAQETVTLSRGRLTPHGHALLKINYSDGRTADCYVNTAWLRDRLDDLGEPRPVTLDTDGDISVDYEAMWRKAERDLATAQFEAATLRADRDAAEEERDEARATIDALREEAHACDVHNGVVIPEPRRLTPDAITDEMIERARQRGSEIVGALWDASVVEAMLTAALTEPPKRPEGAEKLGELIGTWTASEDIAPAQLPTGSLATLADFLAERGVRVVGEEDPR